ncbi:MAG: alanine racemase [Planctomycetota bacterium]|jgi:alanine racemase
MQPRRVWAEIDLDAITKNLDRLRFLAGSERRVMAIVKANAYGHGAVPLAWHLASQGVDMLGVGDSQEAIELREAGLSIPIVVLGAIVPGEMPTVVAHDIEVTVHSGERVRLLEREARRANRCVPVHLKVDTGMGRLGCTPARAPEIARLIDQSDFLRFVGLCTHFSSVDAEPNAFTQQQVSLFENVGRSIVEAGVALPPRHAAASAAALTRVAAHLDLIRPGLALYGIAPDPRLAEGLTPALELKSQVIFLKDLPAGAPVGYFREHTTSRPTRVATLPVGYNDGYPWRLKDRGEVLVRGRRAPVVGRVSMDYLTVDVGRVPGVSVGDEVTLIGRSGERNISAVELAERAGTIPYEILTRLGKRVARVYRGGRPDSRSEADGGRIGQRGFAVVKRPTRD